MRRSNPVSWDQIRVGLVLIAGILVLSLGVFFVGDLGHVFGDRYRLVTLMSSATGLVPGAPVHVAGQAVGQVVEIEFIPPDLRPAGGEAVAVWVAVNTEVQAQVRADSRARVRTQGLLGDRLIDIEPGSPEASILVEGDTLTSAPALSYEDLLMQAADAVEGLISLSRNLTTVTESMLAGEGTAGRLLLDGGMYDQLVTLSGNLNAVLEPVVDGEGALGKLLTDDQLYDRILSSAAALDTFATALVSGEGSLGKLVRSDSLYQTLIGSAGRIDSMLAALQAGDGTMGLLLTNEDLYEEVLRTLVDLNATLQDLRENPRKYIPPIEVF